MSPDLARTTAALEAIGAPARRERDFQVAGVPMRQVFFRLGEVILELVGGVEPGQGDPGFFGLAITVRDLDAAGPELLPQARASLAQRNGWKDGCLSPGPRPAGSSTRSPRR